MTVMVGYWYCKTCKFWIKKGSEYQHGNCKGRLLEGYDVV
jgi:hypothetical protein